jgi:DNA-directed RNA polymerase specialized sigma24 family protein
MQRDAEQRFREIYSRHVEAVTAYVRRRSVSASVEDVVAETFLVCWRRLDRVPDEPLPWLYAVARKTLANERRAGRRRAAPAGGLDAVVGTGDLPELPSDPVLVQAFALLGEDDREVLRLVAWEQLSLRDAATALGCSYLACRVRFHRARRRLAAHLQRLEESAAAAPPSPHPEGATR